MDIPISQDIRKYKTKDVGNFSFKEVGFIALAIGSAVLTYKYINPTLDAAMLPALIIIAIGFVKPFGLTMWEFVRTVLKEDAFSPRTYINETDFTYDPDDIQKGFNEPIRFSEEWDAPQQSIPTVPAKLSKEEMVYFAK